MSTKNIFNFILRIAVLSLLFGFSSSHCPYIGLIKGVSALRCSCCGGWIIEIDDQTYYADIIPNEKQIIGNRQNVIYPIKVRLDFEPAEKCENMRIKYYVLKGDNNSFRYYFCHNASVSC